MIWAPQAPAFTQQATHAITGASFALTSGDTVRLSGIDTPQEEPARQALEKLVAGQTLRITQVTKNIDRHGRMLAHAYLEDGRLIEAELLKQGLAVINDFTYQRSDALEEMLDSERAARKAKRGIWQQQCCRVLAPGETPNYLNQFRLVEGVIESTSLFHGHFYIHFSRYWKGSFTVFISGKVLAHERTQEDFAALLAKLKEGKTVCIRGWIRDHKGSPNIEITSPNQIEVEN